MWICARPARCPWAPSSNARRSCVPAFAARSSGERSSAVPPPPSAPARRSAPLAAVPRGSLARRCGEKREEGGNELGFGGRVAERPRSPAPAAPTPRARHEAEGAGCRPDLKPAVATAADLCAAGEVPLGHRRATLCSTKLRARVRGTQLRRAELGGAASILRAGEALGTARASLAGAACRRCGRAAPSSVVRRCPKGASPAARRSAAAATASFRSGRQPATSASWRARGVGAAGAGGAKPLGTKSRARARHQ